MTAEELASDKASIREATKTREAFDALLSAMLATQDYFYESRREDLERALEEAGEGRKAKALREELERFDELKREADANERPRHHLYEARIRVTDDASNLFDWVARPSEEQLERIRAGLRERGVSEEAAVRLTAAGSFGEIYRSISEELGGAAKASETLKRRDGRRGLFSRDELRHLRHGGDGNHGRGAVAAQRFRRCLRVLGRGERGASPERGLCGLRHAASRVGARVAELGSEGGRAACGARACGDEEDAVLQAAEGGQGGRVCGAERRRACGGARSLPNFVGSWFSVFARTNGEKMSVVK